MMLCSTIIPSYKRPYLLLEAIESFRHTAREPERHEAIVRLSEADPLAEATRAWLLRSLKRVKVIVGRQMDGYRDVGFYYTECLPHCEGEWLNIWDDDMLIEGPWDTALAEMPEDALGVCEFYKLGPSGYPSGALDQAATGWFLRRRTWEKSGEQTINFPPDAWMAGLARQSNWPIRRLAGVTLNHQWMRPVDEKR